ncbi:hypothetical protein VOLCADRAFT_104174 [Volvox carteri f. nagariensis]|uniref:indole-3-glycerol-phosphate synthase n=1 Tax=Volvox carteri f. nagariensis TaxID=3068 RepID=D8TRX5_VOLCA|nr:uncharacterized protein VOLCADRAFT_104174 [Volvox carteri f. nagariensis]EFJ49598.1 hypothetical protein VOLCADRAFT_104174 [Volvox carteri f. nagariensis]|eukprot:XP_002949105.1 hypothetical protein VOLCADRAFT_104174 [Volvox carteri f. nagariensis]
MHRAVVPSASTALGSSQRIFASHGRKVCFQGTRRPVAPWRASSSPNPSGPDDEPPKTPPNALEATIRRKQRELEAAIRELGMEALDERLQSATQVPATPPYRLSRLIAEHVPQGRAVLVFEVARPNPETTSAELAELAKAYVTLGGASALAVRTDSESTPSGLRDLFTVQQAVPRVPVLARDWLIHPLQVCEIKEAGAAGALGIINQGVVFYAINVGVGLSVAIPGFANRIAHGLLGELPFGSISLVGVRSLEEASAARRSGADALLIKAELLQSHGTDVQALGNALQYAVTLDD